MRHGVDAVTHRDIQTWTCWIVAIDYYSAELETIIQFQYDWLFRFLVFLVHDVGSPFCIVFWPLLFHSEQAYLAWKRWNVFKP
jgi:hypothetical protein